MVYIKQTGSTPVNIDVETLKVGTDDLEALVGEKVANPSANSELDRLKKINDSALLIANNVAKEGTVVDIKTNTANLGTPLQNTKIVSPIPQEVGTFEPKVSLTKETVDMAKEATLGLIKAKTDNLDITLTVLKNFLRGVDGKDFTTLQIALGSLLTELELKADITETQPTSNVKLDILLSVLRNDLIGLEGKNFTTLEAVTSLIKTNLDNLLIENEAPLQIDVVGTTTYCGYANVGSAKSGAVWRIKRGVEIGDKVEFTYADGNKNKDNIWDNRLTLIYS